MNHEWEAKVERTLFGNGEMGDHLKVTIMWRIHVWVLCSLSAGAGIIFTILVQKFFK